MSGTNEMALTFSARSENEAFARIAKDDEHATSVVLRGVARHLGEAEEHRAENVPLRPWVPSPKYEVVEIRPAEISGRRFELSRPWLHMRPTATA